MPICSIVALCTSRELRPFMGSQASLECRLNFSDSGNKGSLIVYTDSDTGMIN